MASSKFAQDRLPGGKPVGDMNMDDEHSEVPCLSDTLGATGARITTTAATACREKRSNMPFSLPVPMEALLPPLFSSDTIDNKFPYTYN